MTGHFRDNIEGEPTLAALLADPLTHSVMARDGVSAADVREVCEAGRRYLLRRLARARRGTPAHWADRSLWVVLPTPMPRVRCKTRATRA